MRIPHALDQLVDLGIVEEVLSRLRSGKEADIYLVRSRGELRVAKLYKSSAQRSFKHRADYLEGRFLGNERDVRAVKRKSGFGRRVVEGMWRFAEAETLQRLHAHGVRVPTPYDFVDGVLIMQYVQDAHGDPAPRLKEAELSASQAAGIAKTLLAEIVRMLDAGVIHGDLSEYNILLDADGPVIIDFPQSIAVGVSAHAQRLLVRDVDNVVGFLASCANVEADATCGLRLWEQWSRRQLRADSDFSGWMEGGATGGDGAGSVLPIT